MEQKVNIMNSTSEQPGPAPTDLDAATDQAMAACGGDARETMKTLIVANDFLEASSTGSGGRCRPARGRLPRARERKDEADV